MVSVDRPFDASTFPSCGCGLAPWRTDLAHAVELLPITVRAFRARSAAETTRALCTTEPVFSVDHLVAAVYVCRCEHRAFAMKAGHVHLTPVRISTCTSEEQAPHPFRARSSPSLVRAALAGGDHVEGHVPASVPHRMT